MPKNKKQIVHLVAVLTDKPDAWEMKVKDQARGMQFTIAIPGPVLNKKDITFINNNLQRFIDERLSVKPNQVNNLNAN